MAPGVRGKNKENGFTLVEVIIGMFVIAVALVGLLVMVNNSLRQTNRSYDVSSASQVAADALEHYKTLLANDSVYQLYYDSAVFYDSTSGQPYSDTTLSVTVKNTEYSVTSMFDTVGSFLRGRWLVQWQNQKGSGSDTSRLPYLFLDPSK